MMQALNDGRLRTLTRAFQPDGYDVARSAFHQGKIGLAAVHRTACINGDMHKKKKVFYLEGSPRQMGYLLGCLAEDEISQMTTRYVNNFIWALIGYLAEYKEYKLDKVNKTIWGQIKELLGDAITDMISKSSQERLHDIPEEYIEEMHGILEGCRNANSQTQVEEIDLWALNFGIDWLLAHTFTGFRKEPRIKKKLKKKFMEKAKIPVMCNGFSAFKDAAWGGHYFGRDFMFPTAGVLENTACMIIRRPEGMDGGRRLPQVSVTAPGILGCFAGMNLNGVAAGIEIVPSSACHPGDLGFNSLLLLRHCLEKGESAVAAKDVIIKARRGVPWIYILSDGTNDKACAVESVYSTEKLPFMQFPPRHYVKGGFFRKSFLPEEKFVEEHSTAEQENGAMVRWEDYKYDEAYLEYNKKCFKRFHKKLYPDAIGKKGFINRTHEERNCPLSYYFSPERESRDDIVLATNHFVIPEMRFCAMDLLLSHLAADVINDSQWRYDTLNAHIMDAIEEARKDGKGGIEYDKAKEILDFLNPAGRYPDYYGKDKQVIEGTLSLFDLKKKTVESHYGYYKDEWIKLTFPNYIF
jgi:hypothetical protein